MRHLILGFELGCEDFMGGRRFDVSGPVLPTFPFMPLILVLMFMLAKLINNCTWKLQNHPASGDALWPICTSAVIFVFHIMTHNSCYCISWVLNVTVTIKRIYENTAEYACFTSGNNIVQSHPAV